MISVQVQVVKQGLRLCPVLFIYMIAVVLLLCDRKIHQYVDDTVFYFSRSVEITFLPLSSHFPQLRI